MSDIKPLFIQQFEKIGQVLTTLAAQEIAPIHNETNPEATAILARQLYEKFVNMLGMLKEVNRDFKRGLEVVNDLQVSKAPDVERLAWEVYAHGCSTAHRMDAAMAFSLAENWIKHRNNVRQAPPKSTAIT